MARLVAIGDSITQGFQSLAITHVESSYPAQIARSIGLGIDEFRLPNFQGSGGLPCSLEWLARRLEDKYGSDLSSFEWLRALHAIPSLLDEVEDYWERGRGSRPSAAVDYHNLAVWGFEVADAFQIDSTTCLERIERTKDDWLSLPSEPRFRSAYRVLNPSQSAERNADTQLDVAARIQRSQGGIDHLIVALGANNCLGTVVNLVVRETTDTPPGPSSGFSLWKPKAFEADYRELGRRVKAIGAEHVYVATVPHVTIPPITRGVMRDRGPLPEGRRYFDYYTRFFIRDANFDPGRDPHLSGAEAEYIDVTIDRYNEVIRNVAGEHGFHVVDVCSVLDRLAVRRLHGHVEYPLPPALSDLSIRFFEIHPDGKLKNGGLMSLDGVHPSACGYSLLAHEFLEAMKRNDDSLAGARIDFSATRRWDALISYPPRTLDDVFGALQTLERHFHLSRWMGESLLDKR